ncbi:hypothetical protein [Bradyrhizobium tropiciagri]|uniref:IS66 family transposase n=1 Tax=Bradyrhizobium tropiciagri TaxID=312253 RepID=UPI001FCCC645|nr:hypothetical protein [Bradyrhizobium tropiciagri]
MVLALDAENEKLLVTMQTLREMIFGKRSERLAVLVDEQLVLGLDDLDIGVTLSVAANDDEAAAKSLDRRRKRARRNNGRCPSTCRVVSRCWSRSDRVPLLPEPASQERSRTSARCWT